MALPFGHTRRASFRSARCAGLWVFRRPSWLRWRFSSAAFLCWPSWSAFLPRFLRS